jgi:hypothetical protein
MVLVFASMGVVLSFLSWGVYMAAIARERVPPRPTGHVAVQIAAIASSALAVALGPSLATIVAAIFAAGPAALFLFLLTEARIPDAKIRIAVGQRLLPFVATTSDGVPWSTA